MVHTSQGTPGSHEYRDACRLMTAECNAAIEGALDAGAQEFVVNDSHFQGRNIDPASLNPAAELVSGSDQLLSMCAGLGPGFDAAFFIGYHGSVGTRDAVLDHTYDPRVIQAVRVNGEAQSEGSLNGAVAGYFGCPLALFSGDAAAVSEMHRFVLTLEGVVVKEGIGRYSARALHPSLARERIREGAKRALERLDNIPPLRHSGSLDLEVDLLQPVMADICERIPGVERRAPRTIGFTSEDYLEVFKLFLAVAGLGATTLPQADR